MTDTEETPPPTGPDVIRGYLRTLDASPGVYRMLDAQSRVLYVGKARNLRARVSNYARPTGHTARIARMIRETASMMFLTTATETEALLLEQNLIKQLKPRYNVLLRDDKSFPNILVTAHDYPMIRKHRGAKRDKGSYYGPFASAGAVNRTLAQLQRVFQLRNCTDTMFESRTRPCLQYQIKRCTAPCVGKISKAEYAVQVRDAERYLSGRSTEIQEKLAAQMAEASEAMEYERAAALRDRGRAILVGTSSFGKGSVQTIIRLPNGGELTLTWAHMIAPAGFNLQGHGVIPAICTSAGDKPLEGMMRAVRMHDAASNALFGEILASRQAVRTDPEKARSVCPPSSKERAEDIEIARYILENKSLYTRALSDGGPAIAERD